LAGLGAPGALPGRGRLTTEPGGQIELSSAPAVGLDGCIATACRDLTAIHEAIGPAGLCLAGEGLDPFRSPRRVLDLPRYAAMEEFFNRAGPWGRLMMCSTASVQVCLDAGEEGSGPPSFGWRWRLLHAIGPVLVAAFANSPLRDGRPTGWKSTRQAIWHRLDPSRTRPPASAEPAAAASQQTDPRAAWTEYALAAKVMCVRRAGMRSWCAPAGLTFRDWLRGAGERPATRGDLLYHLSTLFPPVRPRGHLELRVIDAQPGDGWIVPTAVVTALLDDPVAAERAMAAAEVLWCDGDGQSAWLRAARQGPADAGIAAASVRCFEAAGGALGRLGAPEHVRRAVIDFTERYVVRGRCPSDDRLDEARGAGEIRGHLGNRLTFPHTTREE
ncbi:MAG TPA: ergothioneine biosynthesis glutamate--cysteine ligase EgtA, partial [Streptosporangiaceae bacterium]